MEILITKRRVALEGIEYEKGQIVNLSHNRAQEVVNAGSAVFVSPIKEEVEVVVEEEYKTSEIELQEEIEAIKHKIESIDEDIEKSKNEIDFENLSYKDLQELAEENGIKSVGVKKETLKEQVEAALNV